MWVRFSAAFGYTRARLRALDARRGAVVAGGEDGISVDDLEAGAELSRGCVESVAQ